MRRVRTTSGRAGRSASTGQPKDSGPIRVDDVSRVSGESGHVPKMRPTPDPGIYLRHDGPGSPIVRRILALGAVVVVIAGIARAVSSARGDADLLRAPDSAAVDALAGISAPPDTTNVATLSAFPVADTMFGNSGKLRFRTLTRVSAIALPRFSRRTATTRTERPRCITLRRTARRPRSRSSCCVPSARNATTCCRATDSASGRRSDG